ncbi:MAG: hypothetical protein IJF78_02715 [Clostridia bacterium]|nr:hypothetical protein [Clostridia bacterium]
MRKIWLILLLLGAMTACKSADNLDSLHEKYGLSSIPAESTSEHTEEAAEPSGERIITLPEFYGDCAFFGGSLYFASEDGVMRCSLTEDEAVMECFTSEEAVCVDVSGDGVYVLDQQRLLHYLYDGTLAGEHPLKGEYLPVCGVICGDSYIFAARFLSEKSAEDRIFRLVLHDGTITEITQAIADEEAITVTDLQYGGGCLLTAYNTEKMGKREYCAARTDLNDLQTDRTVGLPGIRALDYDPVEETIHYVTGSSSGNITSVYTCDLSGNVEKTAAIRVPAERRDWSYFPEGMPEEMKHGMGVPFESVFCTGEYYILWAMTDKSVYIADADPDRVVTVLAPEQTGIETAIKTAGASEIITMLKTEYDCQIRFLTYPEDEYAARLNTKLLAGDDDFDVFILSGTSVDSVVRNHAFLPPDPWEDVLAGFPDFMKAVLKTEHGILGVPVNMGQVRVMGRQKEECFLEYGLQPLSKNPSMDEYLALMNQMRSMDPGLNLRLGYFTEYILNDFAQIFVDTGDVNRELLTAVMKTLAEDTCGVLYDHQRDDPDEVFFLTDWAVTKEEYPDWGLLPTVDGCDYIGYENYACINPASENAEEAAAYLACLAQYQVQYGIPESEWEKDELYRDVKVKLSTVQSSGILSGSRWIELKGRLQNGSVTPEAAAEEFLQIVRYYYME